MVNRLIVGRGSWWLVCITCLVGFVPSAWADATVHLKNGGRVMGELMEVQPDQQATVLLRDGSTRSIPWAEIDHIDEASAGGRSAGGGAVTPTATASGAAPRRAALDHELERLQQDRAELGQGGNVVMMVAGYVLAPLVLVGVPLMIAGDVCTGDQCTDLFTPGLVLTGLGGVGIVLGVIGLTSAVDNGTRRKQIDEEIDRKQKERDALGYAFGGRPAATPQLTLGVRF